MLQITKITLMCILDVLVAYKFAMNVNIIEKKKLHLFTILLGITNFIKINRYII